MTLRQILARGLAASMLVAPAAAFADRFTPSDDGTEISDAETGLVWRRCAEGMHWDGQTCSGTALSIVHSSAETRARQEARKDKKAWRLPSIAELKSLQAPGHPGELADPAAFPATPEKWFWSVFVDKPGVTDAFNLYFGYGTGQLGDGRDNVYGAVRLVRAPHKAPAKRK